MAARLSPSSPKMGLIVVAEAARYRGGLRDRIVVRLANVLLKFASKQYRELLAEVISHGFDAAAREAGHLRGNPPFTEPLDDPSTQPISDYESGEISDYKSREGR